MKVLLTGATGFIGIPLAKALLSAGHELVVLSRNRKAARLLIPGPCQSYSWQAEQEPVPSAALEGIDAVIHLAGESVAHGRWTAAKKARILDSRVRGTRQLMTSLLRLKQRPVVISASAIGYYGNRGETLLGEDSGPGEGFLAEVCQAWEHEIFQHQEAFPRLAAIRTGIVLGPNGGALQAMLPPFRLGAGGPIGRGRQWMSWIHRDDLVRLFCFVLEQAQLQGPINGVAPHPVRNAEFTRSLGKALKRPALFPAPPPALKLALGQMSELLLASQKVSARKALQAGFDFRYPELAPALADLVRADSKEILIQEQWVPAAPEQIFKFFTEADNLEAITPPWLQFKVLRKSTEQLQVGTVIDYQLKLRGLPLSWQSEITHWDDETAFVDEQRVGPYREWYHRHEFIPFAGGTLLRDIVRYEIPGGRFAQVTLGATVRKDLQKIFAYRQQQIHDRYSA